MGRLKINSMRMWKKNFSNNYSVINDFFYGQYHNIMKCTVCSNETHSFELFCTLDLPIPKKENEIVNISDCMNEFTQTEIRYCKMQ